MKKTRSTSISIKPAQCVIWHNIHNQVNDSGKLGNQRGKCLVCFDRTRNQCLECPTTEIFLCSDKCMILYHNKDLSLI